MQHNKARLHGCFTVVAMVAGSRRIDMARCVGQTVDLGLALSRRQAPGLHVALRLLPQRSTSVSVP